VPEEQAELERREAVLRDGVDAPMDVKRMRVLEKMW